MMLRLIAPHAECDHRIVKMLLRRSAMHAIIQQVGYSAVQSTPYGGSSVQSATEPHDSNVIYPVRWTTVLEPSTIQT